MFGPKSAEKSATSCRGRSPDLIRSVPQRKLPLVLVQPAGIPADNPATEVDLGARKGEGGSQPRRGHGDAQTRGPVRRNAFQREWKLEGVLPGT